MQTLNTLDLQTTSLKIVDGKLWILDQQALPQRQEWLSADTVELLIEHIQALRV
ncbi:S-methyl-5-thioribose-1-phosphate isomerase, partial [Yersinia enterocolitica]